MRPLPLAALLLAGAAALPAQTSAPRSDGRRERPHPDSARSTSARSDTAVREYIIRRFGPGGDVDGPGQIERVRGGAPLEQRSVLGIWLGRADGDGLRVERVTADGPAARASIAAGDRLTAINGTSLRVDRAELDDAILSAVPARRLERAVGRLAPGSEVELRVARDGRERTVRVRTVAPTALADEGTVRDYRIRTGRAAPFLSGPGAAPFRAPFDDSAFADLRRRARAAADSARTRAAARPVLGLTLEAARGARDTLGLFVSAVAPGGPAERAGVVEGDRIAGVNNVDLRVPRDERDDPQAADARRARFTRELQRLRPGDRVTLRVYGDGRWRTVTATTARAADVYRAGPGVRFGPQLGSFPPDLLPFAPGDVAGDVVDVRPGVRPGVRVFRNFRMAPMPNGMAPRFRLDSPDVALPPRAPLPPRPPLPPRVLRRTVVL